MSALVAPTVINVLAGVFCYSLYMNYVILKPYFSALFLAACMSIPLRALKSLALAAILGGTVRYKHSRPLGLRIIEGCVQAILLPLTVRLATAYSARILKMF